MRMKSILMQLMLLFGTLHAMSADAATIEGFTQPFETVNVASPEAGIVESLVLRQGEIVAAGQQIAVLDNGVLQASLAAACAKAESKGPVLAAEAAFRQRDSRRKHMLQLRDDGHASPEELERAESEAAIAEANLVTAREEAKSHALEVKQIEAQIERRTICSPISGVISEIPKRPGEFVTATDATIATVVQIDQLRIIFHVPTERIAMLKTGDVVTVQFASNGHQTQASVEFISPITDAESNLVRIEVILDNSDGKHRSGVRCFLQLNGTGDKKNASIRAATNPFRQPSF